MPPANATGAENRRQRLLRRSSGFWSSDRSLSFLLGLLIFNLFAVPLAKFATWGRLTGRAILSLIIISGVAATVRNRSLIVLISVIAIASLGIGWADIERPNFYLDLFNDVVALIFLAFLCTLILNQVFRDGPITSRRIQGGVAVYLLLGLIWAVAYEIVEVLSPGSFKLGASVYGSALPELGYFSFTTLTTLGVGDILPISPMARSLVVIEALIGQLFPVVLIARLVAMGIESRHR